MGAVDAGVPLLCYREASAPAPPRERRLGAAGPCCMAHLAGVVFFGLVVSLRSLEQQVRLGQSHIGVRNRSMLGSGLWELLLREKSLTAGGGSEGRVWSAGGTEPGAGHPSAGRPFMAA